MTCLRHVRARLPLGASEAGSDVGKMSELDTDDELEEAGRV